MQNDKENFLDSKTFIAIALLIVCWLGWDHYMKQKYPVDSQKRAKEPSIEKVTQNEISQIIPDISPGDQSKRDHKERTLEFKGKNMELVFSSKGLGVKQLKLRNYSDRKKEQIVFNHPETPLFSSFFFKTGDFVPFEIKREGRTFIGVFSSSKAVIKKTIEVNDKQYILKSKIEVKPSGGEMFKGLSLVFSHPLLNEKEKSGFFKILFIYGQDILKGFVSYDGKQKKRFIVKDLEGNSSYFNLNIAALGGKYFGRAFINHSSVFPSVEFRKYENQVQARVDYEFLHSKVQNLKYQAFLGPKSLKNFQELGGEVREWLDFGFFGWLARPLLLFLNWLYSWCKNWGFAIILLTFVVRLCLLPINIKSYKSMKVMQKLQPQIKEIKAKHKSDPKKMNTEVMALMKKNKANPLGGCLPLFIQFPVFFALYRVLGESIELYQSPFIFWIKDLSLKDPYYLLPILGGLVLFVQQRLTPMNLPKEQARLLTAMPLLFSVFMLNLPSGLTLYIFVSGVFGLVQQFFFVKWGRAA